MENKHIAYSKPIQVLFTVLLLIACLVGLKALVSARTEKGALSDKPSIVVTGSGEVYASPDIATVSFEVGKEAKTVAEAQALVNPIITDIKKGLNDMGIEDKDIKTSYYNTYPVYDTVAMGVPCTPSYCPPSRQTIRGYQVTQSIEVKIRKIDQSGDVVTFLGTKGATNISGVTFTLDNPDAVKAEARKQAIEKAEAKAKLLADQLGVKLVRIVSFNDSSDGAYYPMYAKGGAALDAAVSNPAPATLPTGENKIVSNVTITYEIR